MQDITRLRQIGELLESGNPGKGFERLGARRMHQGQGQLQEA